ncbi:MAG: hypothetical protein VX772_01240, partial [Bacteroidota bacterium]|nr:hypothetical protein [Bacteroidota bacterium]
MAFFLFVAAFGQKDAAYSNLTNGIGTEGVYVHYNTNLLFSGEYLNFKLYALSKINQSLSSASKMAYVELLDESGERKIIQKVKLIDGMGQGDIFIPTNLDSGYYTLVAYTAYMKNWSTDTFYSDELIILNPYTNDQEIFWGDKSVSGNNASGSAGTITDTSLELVLNKALFGTREKVELELVPTSNYKGNYSISVRKVYKDLDYGERTSPRDYTKKFTAIDPNPIGAEHLPELRGEIIKGEISSKDGLETTNKKVVFSLPGEAYEYRMVSTDSDGVFMFSLDSENLDTESLFQVWGADKEHYSVTIDDVPE